MSEQSTLPQPVNWEAVRMLALVVGVRESARRMGISEEAVKKRCTREGWLSSPEAKAVNKTAVAQRSGLTVSGSPQLSPTAVLNGELVALGQKTRLSLARGMSTASKFVEEMTGGQIIDNANEVKAIAQTADLVHGWKDAAPQVKIRLDVLSGGAEPAPIDISADVMPSDSWDNADATADPLDEY